MIGNKVVPERRKYENFLSIAETDHSPFMIVVYI